MVSGKPADTENTPKIKKNLLTMYIWQLVTARQHYCSCLKFLTNICCFLFLSNFAGDKSRGLNLVLSQNKIMMAINDALEIGTTLQIDKQMGYAVHIISYENQRINNYFIYYTYNLQTKLLVTKLMSKAQHRQVYDLVYMQKKSMKYKNMKIEDLCKNVNIEHVRTYIQKKIRGCVVSPVTFIMTLTLSSARGLFCESQSVQTVESSARITLIFEFYM